MRSVFSAVHDDSDNDDAMMKMMRVLWLVVVVFWAAGTGFWHLCVAAGVVLTVCGVLDAVTSGRVPGHS